jgi:hypothetical protein
MFLTNASFRQALSQGGIAPPAQRPAPVRQKHGDPLFLGECGNAGTVVVWLNLGSKQEVDDLYGRWRDAGAKVLAEPEDKPWHLREFRVADPDGNQLRVFYDFNWELQRAET